MQTPLATPLRTELKVASYQGPFFESQPQKNLELTHIALAESEKTGIDILCMPECFLQGYFSTKQLALKNSIELESSEFTTLLETLKPYPNTTLLLGLNERFQDQIFNTVVVIENGQLKGKYQKAYTYPPYDYFSLGTAFPVFEKHGIQYSVIICYDSLFREPALISALNGAQILFCPMFNRIAKQDKIAHFLHRKSHFIARAFDSNCWLVCSDITCETDTHICPGYATILDNDGQIMATSQPFTSGLLTYSIPFTSLKKRKSKRLIGNPTLLKIVSQLSETPPEKKDRIL